MVSSHFQKNHFQLVYGNRFCPAIPFDRGVLVVLGDDSESFSIKSLKWTSNVVHAEEDMRARRKVRVDVRRYDLMSCGGG